MESNKEEYDFKRADLDKVNTYLLLEILGFQHAAVDIIISKLNVSEDEKKEMLADFNTLLPLKKKAILEMLYSSLGLTPDVLL